MRRFSFVAASALLASLLLSGRPAAAGWRPGSPGAPGVALGTGAYVFLPYLVAVQDVSGELVLGDRFAIGGKALFALGDPGDVFFAPYVAVGSPRSRSSAAYFAAAWLPGSPLGTLGVGYEGTVRGPVRLYAEAGAMAAVGEWAGLLPYGHVGVRLRF